jgi:hypothetical protein
MNRSDCPHRRSRREGCSATHTDVAGLDATGVLDGFNATPHAEVRLSRQPDLALLTVSTQGVVAALRENAAMLRGVPIVVLLNGLRAEALAATRDA